MALHIYIDTIPHSAQRYPTVGDYWRPAVARFGLKRLEIRVSAMDNEDYEFLVAIHELIEAHLTHKRGISEDAITEFDMDFEEQRAEGNTDEPGDSPNAPYRAEHQFATLIEKLVATELGIDWVEYEKIVNSLE